MKREYPFYKVNKRLSIHSVNSAFMLECDDNFCFEGEIHNFWEMAFIAKGSALIVRDTKALTLNAGDVIFYKPMEFHCLRANNEPFTVIIISFNTLDKIISPLGEVILNLNSQCQEMVFKLLHEMEKGFVFTSDGGICGSAGSLIAENSAIAMLEHFLLTMVALSPSAKKVDGYASSEFTEIIDVMMQNLDKDLSVEEIAELVGHSVVSLKKIFKKHTGGGVSKHFMMLKIRQAIMLLREGRSVAEVSDSLGFSSPSYFSYAFQREVGKSPVSFKNKP